jgi:hypothetical protein
MADSLALEGLVYVLVSSYLLCYRMPFPLPSMLVALEICLNGEELLGFKTVELEFVFSMGRNLPVSRMLSLLSTWLIRQPSSSLLPENDILRIFDNLDSSSVVSLGDVVGGEKLSFKLDGWKH